MEQRSNYVAVKDAQTKFIKEEYAKNMEQRENTHDAALKDARIKLEMREFVWDMVQRSNYAAVKDVQINPNEEDYAEDMVHIATITKNLQLSHHMLDLYLI